jgi:serine protease
MRRPAAVLLTAALLGGFVLVASTAAVADRLAAREGTVTPGISFAPTDQVIVKMQAGQIPSANSLGRNAGVSVTSVRNLTADTIVLKLPGVQSDAALRATVNALAKSPGVEFAEPDVRMSVSEDRSSEQWDLGPAGPTAYGIDLAGAWAGVPANPAQVTVAVVDTGYVEHADLTGQFVGGYDFVSDSRIGNDGDGRDSDAHDPGDWITNQDSRRGFFRGCAAGDSSWHGTHVSGTIAALANVDGINGINPNAKILPVRVLGKCGGYTSDITDGVRWAAGLAVNGVPTNTNVAKVVNLSLGGGGACASTWQSAINDVTAAGTTVVVAAGNSNADAAGYSPASCNGVITVASTGKAGSRAYYSNFGTSVEIAAPGGDRIADDGDTILSTLNTGATSPSADTYAKYQGTSMAAPHIAGVASLMLAANPTLTPIDIVQVMQQTATPFPGGSSCATGCGSGIANAASAVAAAISTDPTTTTTTTATTTTTVSPTDLPGTFAKTGPIDGTNNIKKNVTLSWQSSDAATEYWVCIDTAEDGNCDAFTSGPYTGTSVRFVGLASGTTYEWQVQATNSNGATIASDAVRTFQTR